MSPELQKLCDGFITSREEIKKAFKAEFSSVYPICANIFLSYGKIADSSLIKKCRSYIRTGAGPLNNFRGTMYAPAACLLACSPDPAEKMTASFANYNLLKEYFKRSDQLVLASMVLTATAAVGTEREKAGRAKVICSLTEENHRFLIGEEDSVLAVLLSFSGKTNEELTNSMEECRITLKGMTGRDHLPSVSGIFALSDKPSAEKCARFKELFDAFRSGGVKYVRNCELPVLASLAVSDAEIGDIVRDVTAVGDFLKTQKGYKGIFGENRRTAFVHAAMIVSTYLSPSVEIDAPALPSMIPVIAMGML